MIKVILFSLVFLFASHAYSEVDNDQWQDTGETYVDLINQGFEVKGYDMTNFKDEMGTEKSSNVTGYGVGFDFTYFYKNSEIKYGLDVNALRTSLYDFTPFGIAVSENDDNSEFSGYVNYKYKNTRFVIEPGIALQKYSSGASFEPRLGIKYIVTEYYILIKTN